MFILVSTKYFKVKISVIGAPSVVDGFTGLGGSWDRISASNCRIGGSEIGHL